MKKNTDKPGEIVITRVFDAPRGSVWKAWTEREHLVQWWGQPKGATMPFSELDFRIGGSFRYSIRLPDGTLMWGKSIFREIVEAERLVFDDVFTDEKGNPIINADTPQMKVSATFEDAGKKTKVTIIHSGISGDLHSADQYKQGWDQVLDRLADDLAKTTS